MSAHSETAPAAGRYLVVYAFLLALLGATYGLAYLDLGAWNAPLSFAIAAAKAALILAYFMHLDRNRGVVRVFAAAGLYWLGILFTLALSDYLTRGWMLMPGPWLR